MNAGSSMNLDNVTNLRSDDSWAAETSTPSHHHNSGRLPHNTFNTVFFKVFHRNMSRHLLHNDLKIANADAIVQIYEIVASPSTASSSLAPARPKKSSSSDDLPARITVGQATGQIAVASW